MSVAVVSVVVAFFAVMITWAWYGPAGMRAAAVEWRRFLKACAELHAVFVEVAVEPWLRKGHGRHDAGTEGEQ